MGNARVIKPAIQNRPATFGDLTVNGNETINGSLAITGISDVSQSIAEGIAGNTTVSSSFTSTLAFTSDKIMSTTVDTPVTMSIDGDLSIIGKVIMTDIFSTVGLNLPSSDFKVLDGAFNTSKRNYVYYHYIGGGTALVKIYQELT